MKTFIFLGSLIFGTPLFAAGIDCNKSSGFLIQTKEECERVKEVNRLRDLALCRYNAKDIKKEVTKACKAAEEEEKKKHQEEVQKCLANRAKYDCAAYAAKLDPEGAARVDTCNEGTWERDRGVGEEGMYKGEVNWTGASDSAQFAGYCAVAGTLEFGNGVVDAGKGAGNLISSGYNYVMDRVRGIPRPSGTSLAEKAKAIKNAGVEQFNKIQIKFQCYTPRAQQEMACIAAASNVLEFAATGGAVKLLKFAGVGSLALKVEGGTARQVATRAANGQISTSSIVQKTKAGLQLAGGNPVGAATSALPAETPPPVKP
ncbi:MAG: hypothetical protein WC635_01280 [Bacteriovorax sp.]|jgi:hypothetical protein